jgi:hypothetical protein
MREKGSYVVESELLKNITIGELIDFLITHIKKDVMKKKVVEVLLNLFAKIERHDVRVEDIVTNAEYYSLIRKYCQDLIDPSTRKDEIQKGFMGKIWNSNLWVNKSVTEISCYSKNCQQLEIDFPGIAEAKKTLNI